MTLPQVLAFLKCFHQDSSSKEGEWDWSVLGTCHLCGREAEGPVIGNPPKLHSRKGG